MKKILLFFAFLWIALGVHAQPPAGEALPGEVYGDGSGIEVASVVKKLSAIEADEVWEGTFTGKAAEVCVKKGCWIRLELEDGQSATVKMKNYGFFVPLSLVGKEVFIDGMVELKITLVDELRHLAEDAGKSREEIERITEPEETITILATGIKVAG